MVRTRFGSNCNVFLILFFCFFYFSFIKVDNTFAADYKKLISKKNSEISTLKKRLQSLQQKKKKLEADEKNSIKIIENLENEIEITEKLFSKLEQKRLTIQRDLDSVETDYTKEEKTVAELSDKLNKFIKNMYLILKHKDSQMLINFKNVHSIKRYLLYYKMYYKYGISLRDSLNRKKEFLSFKKSELDKRVNELSQTREELVNKERDLKKLKKAKKNYVKKIRNSKEELELELASVLKSKKEVERVIENLVLKSMKDKKRKNIVGHKKIVLNKSMFSMPVKGKIVRGFGKYVDKKYKTTLLNKGVDIKASKSLNVYAATSGKVVKVGYFRNLKNYIIIENSSGVYTFYSKLDKINVLENDKVKRDDIIATLSKSDNVLHFEIRKGKKAVDPVKYLR